MNNNDESIERVREVRRKRLRLWIDTHHKGIQARFVDVTNINQGELSGLLKGTKTFGEEKARSLETIVNMPYMWLDKEDDTAPVIIHARPIIAYSSLDELPQESTVLIASARVELSAGNGKKHWDVVESDPLPFQTDYLKRIKAAPKNLLAAKVSGRSMEPRLFDGDTVVIDRTETRIPTNGGVFALVYGDELMVKRIFMLPDGLRIQSDNALEGPTFELIGERANSVNVIGRVKYRSGTGDF